MPPPDMPPSIQKPQKSVAEFGARALDQRLGVEIARPTGMMVWIGPSKLRCVHAPIARDVAALAGAPTHFVEDADGLPAGPSTRLRSAAGISR